MRKGDLVRLRAYENQIVVRRVIEVRGQSAIVSTDEELEAAAKDERAPVCIGFPLSDVVGREAESQ